MIKLFSFIKIPLLIVVSEIVKLNEINNKDNIDILKWRLFWEKKILKRDNYFKTVGIYHFSILNVVCELVNVLKLGVDMVQFGMKTEPKIQVVNNVRRLFSLIFLLDNPKFYLLDSNQVLNCPSCISTIALWLTSENYFS